MLFRKGCGVRVARIGWATQAAGHGNRPAEARLNDLDLLDGETEPFGAAVARGSALAGAATAMPAPVWARLGAPDHAAVDAGATLRAEVPAAARATLARTAPEVPHRTALHLRRVHVDGESDELRVLGTIGQGGMAVVELAEQRSLGREVAVKRPLHDDDGANALLEEARLTGALEHPAIVPVHELVLDDAGAPAMVMKRLEGSSWRDVIERDHAGGARLDEDAVTRHVRVAVALCNALEYAHSRQIAHLDVKPDNVMVGHYGEVWLLDWGVACRLDAPDRERDEQLVGTPSYMAPEQLRGRCAVDARTDVFLVGASLHHALTGEARHGGGAIVRVVQRAHASPPYDYSALLPDALGAVLNRACAREPADRFADVGALRAALEGFLRHRDAIALTALARADLLALEAAVDALRGEDATAQRAIEATATRARFGFEAALHTYAGYAEAREGLRRTLEASIRFELWRENVAAAAALLESLDAPAAALVAKVRAAQKRAAERGDVFRELEAMRRDATFRGADWRSSLGLLGNGLLWAAILLGLFAIEQSGEVVLDSRVNLYLGLALATLTSLLVWAVRGLLLENRIRRSFLMAIGAYLAAMVLHRAVDVIRDVSFREGLQTDWMILFVFMAVTAAVVEPMLWIAAGVSVVGALLSAWMPVYTLLIAAAAIFLVNATVAWTVRPRSVPR